MLPYVFSTGFGKLFSDYYCSCDIRLPVCFRLLYLYLLRSRLQLQKELTVVLVHPGLKTGSGSPEFYFYCFRCSMRVFS